MVLQKRPWGREACRKTYHMEYLAKRADGRVFHRKKEKTVQGHIELPNTQQSEIDLFSMVEELKFVVPTTENRKKIMNLWSSTFEYRSQFRSNQDFHSFIEEFPVTTAFDGELVEYDFRRMWNQTMEFVEQWNTWQHKILMSYKHLYREISNDFLRALAIIRAKNPTRGSKRVRDERSSEDNSMNGLIYWIKLDDPLPVCYEVPVLIIRGNLMTEGEQHFVSWDIVNMPVGDNIVRAFSMFCQCFDVFGIPCAPSDKQFMMFFRGIIFSVDKVSTTGEKFVRSLEE
ncbi:uncharacterized protein LOC134209890 [Armigeres subalbatus]|uniref:uncharacterized protein LOC134209890 n=1 Tax=Armigeres subalbatus TaxID=124917 RepID=UPI002ED3A808